MNNKLIDRLVAGFVFVYAFVIYVMTMAPTASFWDCGEFIAIANRLQVSHPPGAPFYMLVGRFFSMFFTDGTTISLSINMLSVLCSALTVLFAHLIIVHLIEEWSGSAESWDTGERIIALSAGVIGALTFAVTDSFWFNAVEAEVYAISMFFTAIVVWLIMQWAILIREEQSRRLSGGRFEFGPTTSRYLVIIAYLFGLALGVHLLNLLAIFFVALIVFFQLFDRAEWTAGQRFTGLAVTGVVSSLCFFAIYPGVVLWLPELARMLGSITMMLILTVIVATGAVYFTQVKRMQIANLVAVSFAVILIGYSTYALIFIRSAANPPIDENDPEDVEAIVSYLKREQYGESPMFPRRHSPLPVHQREYARYTSDMEFFWDYQVNHMYIRYFMWNFVGRAGDTQNSDWITGFRPASQPMFRELTPSEKAGRNYYFALPFLLGLLGAVYHFRRDWRRAFAVFMLFFITGLGIIVYLNQTPIQPRERDYSYVASFFAFSLWIGIGAYGLLESIRDALRNISESDTVRHGGTLAVATVMFLAVPLWMAYQNYDDHDRTGRYIATDYAHNLLMSVESNGVIFTNGDNDTFPLWYMQEVEGLRQDVRVVCLSLLNTPWYIRQLKDQWSRDSEPIPMSYTEEDLRQIGPARWQPREISLPVRKDRIFSGSEVNIPHVDTSQIESPMKWVLQGRPLYDDLNMLHVADQAALDILAQNAIQKDWERPIYFANTTSQDGQLNLQNYFQAEGLGYRVVPIKHDQPIGGRVVPEIAMERFRQFRFTNLDNPDVYYDENIRRMTDNYRITFAHAAQQMAAQGYRVEAKEMLDSLVTKLPFEVVPGDTYSTLLLKQGYESIGDRDGAVKMAKHAEPYILEDLMRVTNQQMMARVRDWIQSIEFTYIQNQDYESAAAFTSRLARATGDSSYAQTADQLRELYDAVFNSANGAGADSTTGTE